MKGKIVGVIILVIVVIFGVWFFLIREDHNTVSSIVATAKPTFDVTEEGEDMNVINISIGNNSYQVTLEDNDTARSFYEMLPLDISMSELNGNEKYYYLDKSLPSNPTRVGQITKGDIMLYGDNCLVLFYESFTTSYSYTKIGHVEVSDLDSVVGTGSTSIIFTK